MMSWCACFPLGSIRHGRQVSQFDSGSSCRSLTKYLIRRGSFLTRLGPDASVSLSARGLRLAAHASRSPSWLAQLKLKSLERAWISRTPLTQPFWIYSHSAGDKRYAPSYWIHQSFRPSYRRGAQRCCHEFISFVPADLRRSDDHGSAGAAR